MIVEIGCKRVVRARNSLVLVTISACCTSPACGMKMQDWLKHGIPSFFLTDCASQPDNLVKHLLAVLPVMSIFTPPDENPRAGRRRSPGVEDLVVGDPRALIHFFEVVQKRYRSLLIEKGHRCQPRASQDVL
jgi:hypothetical protein